ncbi:MAG TPA: HIT family protein [Verrucomicrobiae bacterium]|nr:HIT family protein [Verrucomicrobiae bacterium]
MTFDESCIFCKIVRKQAPVSMIYEDETVMAFLDIRPLNEGHTLVVPKKHYVDIFDTPEYQLNKVHTTAKIVSIAVKKTTNADGISVIQQNGKAAGQDIFHFHVHVVPRFEGQKLPSFSALKEVERVKLDSIAKMIKQQLKNLKGVDCV